MLYFRIAGIVSRYWFAGFVLCYWLAIMVWILLARVTFFQTDLQKCFVVSVKDIPLSWFPRSATRSAAIGSLEPAHKNANMPLNLIQPLSDEQQYWLPIYFIYACLSIGQLCQPPHNFEYTIIFFLKSKTVLKREKKWFEAILEFYESLSVTLTNSIDPWI